MIGHQLSPVTPQQNDQAVARTDLLPRPRGRAGLLSMRHVEMAGETERESSPEVLAGLARAVRTGEAGAKKRLLEAVYDELRALAECRMTGERGPALRPTTLVNEAWFRMFRADEERRGNRPYFFKAAAVSIRRVLVDHARTKKAEKRSHVPVRVALDDDLGFDDPEILAVDQALTKLEGEDERLASIVELRYFAGLTIDETAKILGLAASTIEGDWQYAKAWLKREIARRRESDP